MKKQILILFIALFALSATQVYAQGPYLPPNEVECIDLDDPLTPVAGRPYTYSVTVDPPADNTFHWFVTQEFDFIVEGVLQNGDAEVPGGPILAQGVEDVDHYNVATPDANSIELIFQSFSMDEYEFVFIVVWVEHDDEEGCVTDNLKVYRIQPLHAFALTVGNIYYDDVNEEFAADDAIFPEICVDKVQSAIFNENANDGAGGVFYDYGQNAFYFAVAAANFSGNFQVAATFGDLQGPTSNDGGEGQVANLYYDTSLSDLMADGGGNLAGEVDNDQAEAVTWEMTPDAGTSYGEGAENDDDAAFMFYIKVVVDHNQFEAADAAGYEYTLALSALLPHPDDGYTSHSDGDNPLGDIDNTLAEGEDCARNPFGLHNQIAQTLIPRPDVTPDEPEEFVEPTGNDPE